MNISCWFYEGNGATGCRALDSGGVLVERDLRSRIESALCRSGHFIQCPIFERAQQWLERARATDDRVAGYRTVDDNRSGTAMP